MHVAALFDQLAKLERVDADGAAHELRGEPQRESLLYTDHFDDCLQTKKDSKNVFDKLETVRARQSVYRYFDIGPFPRLVTFSRVADHLLGHAHVGGLPERPAHASR